MPNKNEAFGSMQNSIKTSATRLGRMAQQGNRVAILKLAGIIIAVVIVLYWVVGFLLRHRGSKAT